MLSWLTHPLPRPPGEAQGPDKPGTLGWEGRSPGALGPRSAVLAWLSNAVTCRALDIVDLRLVSVSLSASGGSNRALSSCGGYQHTGWGAVDTWLLHLTRRRAAQLHDDEADRDSRRPRGVGPTVEEVDSDQLFLASLIQHLFGLVYVLGEEVIGKFQLILTLNVIAPNRRSIFRISLKRGSFLKQQLMR